MKSLASSRKLSSAVVGAKSIRACDSCVKKRARLFCAADDAFLCQSCDASVHSANTLARRHKRVRLKTGTESDSNPKLEVSVPTWHQGFTRKARTPRLKKHAKLHHHHHHHPQTPVPEFCSDEQSRQEEEEEDLHFRVPVIDHFVPSDVDEFAADVDCLLGRGMEDESFNMEELGLLESRHEYIDGGMGEDFCGTDVGFEMGRGNKLEIIRDDFRAGPRPCESEKEEPKSQRESHKTFLKLDFGRVMSDWDGEKSPWINGEWPEMSYSEFSTDIIGTGLRLLGHGSNMFGHPAGRPSDGDREARVSRYREKRRTRLFSKKIRYEVRKLNAEKRPRMKGRFIKRADLQTPANFV